MLCCLLILPYHFLPHIRYHKWHLHTVSCCPFTSAQFLCLPLSILLPPLFLPSSLSFIAFSLEEFVSAVGRAGAEAFFFQRQPLLAACRAFPRIVLCCLVSPSVRATLQGVPLIRYSSWLFEDASVSVAGCVSAEAQGMWVFAVIYIHGWMQPTWSRMFCLCSSHREVWLKSPVSECMCDCVSLSADGQTSSE